MMKVIEMHVGAKELRKAESILGEFSKVVAPMMKETDALHGDMAGKNGMDIEEVAEDLRMCIMIGAAACGMLAGVAQEAEEKEGEE